jgi:DNA-binding MarR family transcriptional regulator
LEAAGLIERTTAEKVKRTNFVRLTQDGVRRLRRALTRDDAD